MADRERRGAPARPWRLILIAGLNAAALVVLIHLLGGGGGGESAEAREVPPTEVADELPAAAPAEPSEVERLLDRGIRAAISEALAAAARHSKGKANSGNCTVSVCVREAGRSGPELVAIDADRAVRPASNMKLVTTAAALILLGPAWSFETPVALDEEGNLILRAGGDPFWRDGTGGAVEDQVAGPIAEALTQRSARAVENVVLDEGTYPEPGPGPGWPPENQHWQASCALSGGFSMNGGLLVARVEPGSAGARANLAVHPAPHGLSTRYGVDTVSGGVNDVRVGATRTAVTVKGKIGASLGPLAFDFAHPDPVQLFGSALVGALERRGVEVRGEIVRRREAPAGAPLCTLRSPILGVLRTINEDSNNAVADQLFFATGQAVVGEGTREGGARAAERALSHLGVTASGLVQVDGSGLSRDNRATARQLAALIAAVLEADPASASAFLDSLAVAGQEGTLEDRMRGTQAAGRVRAKTGWIRGASALSGVATAADGRELVFSILVAYPAEIGGLNTHAWKPLGDDIATLLCEFEG